ncbi:hypothetical protein GF385_03490, partial [Candidatus Dependentiae bacterium]|nr:hypothetical protein [Candidatus Dependentiae bacterium]
MKKNLFKKLFIFITVLAFTITPTKISCMDFDDMNFDDMDIDLDMLDEVEYVPSKSLSDIFDKLLPVIEEIETPLWNKTKQPKGRDTLYLIPHRISSLEYGGLIFNLFFNYTNKMDFSINEVLKLDENKSALNEFTQTLIEELDANEASALIPLFKRLTIQERKIGALIQLGFILGAFRIEIDSSLQFSERNFWLSKRDQARIKEMFSDANSTFDDKELYKTKFGMGDTRIKLGLNSLNMSNFQVDIGFEGILPTSKFSTDPRLKQYEINLENLENDIPDILRSIRDNLITPQLGNFGHFGLGCYFESKIDLFHNSIHLWNRASFDNLFSAKEDRLIPSKQTIQTPVDIASLLDPEYATKFIKEYIFPPAYRVKIHPGDIINFVSALSFEIGKKWNFVTGYDYYHQQEEQFETIYT